MLLPQPCPVCEQILMPLVAEDDPSDILYICLNMVCKSKDPKSKDQDVWDIHDLEELREAKRKFGHLKRGDKRI